MTPETKVVALEALAFRHDSLLFDEARPWRLLPLERKHRGLDLSDRGIQRRRIARELCRIRRAMRELRSTPINLGSNDCE